jgi:CheY-like chemotaxis protein
MSANHRVYRVNLLGFGNFERRTLESVFRLSTSREPAYEVVDMPADADFLVVDADQPSAVQLAVAAERLGEAVFIGSLAPPGATAWMARPIEPLHVLRELDALHAITEGRASAIRDTEPATLPAPLDLSLRQQAVDDAAAAIARAPAPRPPTAPAVASRAPMPQPTAKPAPPAAAPPATNTPTASVARATPSLVAEPAAVPGAAAAPPVRLAAAPRPAPPCAGAPPESGGPRALLVDDSDLALHFLARLLQRHGLQCQMAASSARALELIGRQHFDVVFMDVELGDASDMDGLALCQHIRRRQPGQGRAVPLLALVSAHHSEIDRVRGTLAGADTYLAKPLDDAALAHWLRRQGLAAESPGRPVTAPRP